MAKSDEQEEYIAKKKASDRNYWLGIISLILVAVFVPERYSILIFLGAIWVILFEISERLREQYYLHKRTAAAATVRLSQNDNNIEN
ncbi:MAG: hypothetical protein M0018_07660 [Nitrospiraceae bacterium]|nr:hypothetical protein [Nitrospiraceae bacterium]